MIMHTYTCWFDQIMFTVSKGKKGKGVTHHFYQTLDNQSAEQNYYDIYLYNLQFC